MESAEARKQAAESRRAGMERLGVEQVPELKEHEDGECQRQLVCRKSRLKVEIQHALDICLP